MKRMPSNVTNVITVNNVSDERVVEILAAIRMDKKNIKRNSIDFNKIIPIPSELKNKQKYGAADWYEWSMEHWGTNWNSYGYKDFVGCDPYNQIRFLTACSNVELIMERLSEMFPDAEFHYRWADEVLGVNMGEQVWENGWLMEENIPAWRSAKAYEMAAEIKGFSLDDFGFQYSEEYKTYQYVGNNEAYAYIYGEDEFEEVGGVAL